MTKALCAQSSRGRILRDVSPIAAKRIVNLGYGTSLPLQEERPKRSRDSQPLTFVLQWLRPRPRDSHISR
eukprot:1353818-Amphidinium_carterae.1